MTIERVQITVSGAVQGVGFRPHVHRLAQRLELDGFVRNRGADVEIEVEGARVADLVEALAATPPPLAAIDRIASRRLPPLGAPGFRIASSVDPSIAARPAPPPRVLADLVSCPECLGEVGDRHSRYFRYPFTSCTHCGPRYSIQTAVPYDRAQTSMAAFALCGACLAEYGDPTSRRFHAQATACPACGPRLSLVDRHGRTIGMDEAALTLAVEAIAGGGILALKGLGGYQLVVASDDAAAVATLRRRKRRPRKPFALMVRSLDSARALCRVSDAEAALLTSPAGPIVLLEEAGGVLAEAIAPGLRTLGVMLPTTPLHHLLLEALKRPIVCTSGNVSEAAIAYDDAEALECLAGIADLWLTHDRPIVRPLDDSVARVIDDAPQVLRIGRGLAPVVLSFDCGEPVLGSGATLKNTIAMAAGGRAVVSQHLGDLDDACCLAAMHRTAADLGAFHRVTPVRRAVDAHPDCIAALDGPGATLPQTEVPHHLAHALAALLEHGLEGPVLAFVWDGTGYGPDGMAWGGECLRVERSEGVRWVRLGHLRPYRLPGADRAARDPMAALSGLRWEAPALQARIPANDRRLLEGGIAAPWTSSAGRLFDGIGAIAGFEGRQTYEGEAACWLEQAATSEPVAPYPLVLNGGVIDWVPLIEAAEADADAGTGVDVISARAHRALAEAIATQARMSGLARVVLTGGCFQNRLLSELTCAALRAGDHTPVLARRLPPNDGGIAAGQIVALAEGVVV